MWQAHYPAEAQPEGGGVVSTAGALARQVAPLAHHWSYVGQQWQGTHMVITVPNDSTFRTYHGTPPLAMLLLP